MPTGWQNLDFIDEESRPLVVRIGLCYLQLPVRDNRAEDRLSNPINTKVEVGPSMQPIEYW